MVKDASTRADIEEIGDREGHVFRRVTVFVVAIENYRIPSNGESLPSVEFAHADADAFSDVIRKIYYDFPDDDVSIHILKDANASLIAVRDELSYTIKNLTEEDLFILYYAGHGFHGAGGNRLSTFDTNRTNVEDTSLSMRDDLLDPLAESQCRHALIFVDACAEKFKSVIASRDVISNLDPNEIHEFLDSAWYLGVFLSCSPGEKSYPATTLRHGIWTHFLLEAMAGRAPEALTKERWLTDFGLRDYLRKVVPRFLTRETQIRGSQTPQAVLSGSNSFRIHHIPPPPSAPPNAALASITLQNNSEFLEGTETGSIRNLSGFKRGTNQVPDKASDSADNWCRRLLSDLIADELQTLYEASIRALKARRKEVQKGEDTGVGDLDTAAFRYSVNSGQDPEDPSQYIIYRRLELRQGWSEHRTAIDEIFSDEFDCLVIEFEKMGESFDDLVDKLEDIGEIQGGEVRDDDRTKRVSYKQNGAVFIFDLAKRRLEISFGRSGTTQLVDAAQQFQLGTSRPSPMLAAPSGTAHPTLPGA